MRKLHYTAITFFSIYFICILLGTPTFNSKTNIKAINDANTKIDDIYTRLRQNEGKGLIEKTLIKYRAFESFRDAKLSRESSPDLIMRNLERSISGDTFLIFITIFWITAFLLTIPALYKAHWFYDKMIVFLLLPSMLFILLSLLKRNQNFEINMLEEASLLGIISAYVEITLLSLGIYIIFNRFLPENPGWRLTENRFMGHLNKGIIFNSQNRALSTLLHLLLIVFVALLMANLFLLPLFIIQLNFPNFFIALIFVSIILLITFYSRSYTKVSQAQNADANAFSSISFLGYRILKNSLFIGIILFLILLSGGFIVTISVSNIDLLQAFHLLGHPETM